MFTDSVKIGIWAQQAVEQSVQLGIVKGYSDGSFHPDAEIQRPCKLCALEKYIHKFIAVCPRFCGKRTLCRLL
ncbi:S-layer homology domain-containing protein [Paenibacillus sp. VTT E-133291]